ncbi:MAG TPA: hypothetical protein DCY86_16535 [Bdellovibrionales bacterium]|nr:hypothetical protein [Bdellovibrionales bacterium]
MKGGRKDNFFFCLLEHFDDGDRWFLRSLLQVKDEEGLAGDEAIREWIKQYEIRQLVLDFPLTNPPCHECVLQCPGALRCPVVPVCEVRMRMEQLLQEDRAKIEQQPKRYEQERNDDDLVHHGRDWHSKIPTVHILSRSFKRRLKRGFLPYWNRPLDFLVWTHYYDALLKIFNQTYDSFGNTSLVIISRFSYLRRHFPAGLELFEAHILLILIEMVRANLVRQQELQNLYDLEQGRAVRLEIIQTLEKKLNVFIYDYDMDILVKHPRAFESFLMAIAGICLHQKQMRPLPSWIGREGEHFIIPKF